LVKKKLNSLKGSPHILSEEDIETMEEDQKNELLSAAKLRTGVSPEKDWSSSLVIIFTLVLIMKGAHFCTTSAAELF